MTQSKTRSNDSGPPEWAENWRLLRELWPAWSPTDDQAKEVWWKCYDLPHAIRGPGTVNQRALREAIRQASRTSRWKEPNFMQIADFYKHERGREIAELDRLSFASEAEREASLLQSAFERQVSEIRRWTTERIAAAQAEVGRNVRSFANKSSDPSSWSRVYVGLLVAADEELGGTDAKT